MSNYTTIFKTPPTLSNQYVEVFIRNIKDIFGMVNTKRRDVLFDVSNTKNIDILGLLLIYKFFDFTVKKNCFINPKTNLDKNKKVSDEMKKTGFKNIVDEYFTYKDPIEEDLKYSQTKDFFLAPIILEKGKSNGVGKVNKKKIADYYSYDSNIASMILLCVDEIASNFQEHAVEDTKSVIIAKGNKDHIEIACADNGLGIISTLSPYLKWNDKKPVYNVLKKAVEKEVTSKKNSNHMGCGLWIVNQFVTVGNGKLYIFSQNAYLSNKKRKIKCGECSYWQGTIVYIDVPLINSKEFLKILDNKNSGIKLNII